jgi:hypothetical protein
MIHHGPHRKHRFQQLFRWWMRVCCRNDVTTTESLPNNKRVYRPVPYQRLSLLASQFWLSADMPQNIKYELCKTQRHSIYMYIRKRLNLDFIGRVPRSWQNVDFYLVG